MVASGLLSSRCARQDCVTDTPTSAALRRAAQLLVREIDRRRYLAARDQDLAADPGIDPSYFRRTARANERAAEELEQVARWLMGQIEHDPS